MIGSGIRLLGSNAITIPASATLKWSARGGFDDMVCLDQAVVAPTQCGNF